MKSRGIPAEVRKNAGMNASATRSKRSSLSKVGHPTRASDEWPFAQGAQGKRVGRKPKRDSFRKGAERGREILYFADSVQNDGLYGGLR